MDVNGSVVDRNGQSHSLRLYTEGGMCKAAYWGPNGSHGQWILDTATFTDRAEARLRTLLSRTALPSVIPSLVVEAMNKLVAERDTVSASLQKRVVPLVPMEPDDSVEALRGTNVPFN